VYDNSDHILTRVVGGMYKVPKIGLDPSPMKKNRLLNPPGIIPNPLQDDDTTPEMQNLYDFMDPENNALVKSFESVKGKGLAGFITDMSFDWMNQTLWEITPGSKAPQMCVVTMAFSPLHDITPGLDSVGFNRAPIYPVGLYNPTPEKKK
jgi:hypothetical protein